MFLLPVVIFFPDDFPAFSLGIGNSAFDNLERDFGQDQLKDNRVEFKYILLQNMNLCFLARKEKENTS